MSYFVMGYDNYYPGGGFNDCHGIFDNVDTARTFVIEKLLSSTTIIGKSYVYDFIDIYKVENGELVTVQCWTYGVEGRRLDK